MDMSDADLEILRMDCEEQYEELRLLELDLKGELDRLRKRMRVVLGEQEYLCLLAESRLESLTDEVGLHKLGKLGTLTLRYNGFLLDRLKRLKLSDEKTKI
jgi:hypothetical protein